MPNIRGLKRDGSLCNCHCHVEDGIYHVIACCAQVSLWWDYLCPQMANINALKNAQKKLMDLGVDFAEAGKILSEVQKFYVDAAYDAATKYEKEIHGIE